jgi:hypothetical protein
VVSLPNPPVVSLPNPKVAFWPCWCYTVPHQPNAHIQRTGEAKVSGQPLKPIQDSLTHIWAQLNPGQRRALVILVGSNLLVIVALLLVLLRPPAFLSDMSIVSPLSPSVASLAACREQTSRALLKAGYTGLVQTEPDGTVLLQLQWPQSSVLRQTPLALTARASEDAARSRLDADAAIWAALEVAARASREGCLGFQVLQVTVSFPGTCATAGPAPSEGTNDCQAQRATARVRLTDLLMWSMGELDDAELSLRVDYFPPAPNDE